MVVGSEDDRARKEIGRAAEEEAARNEEGDEDPASELGTGGGKGAEGGLNASTSPSWPPTSDDRRRGIAGGWDDWCDGELVDDLFKEPEADLPFFGDCPAEVEDDSASNSSSDDP